MISENQTFKTCPCCGTVWERRRDFLSDPAVTIVGYQPHFEDLELGFFLFNHSECGSTVSLQVSDLSSLFPGPVFSEARAEWSDWPEFCLRADELRSCPVQCECAYVRDMIELIESRDTPDGAKTVEGDVQ